MLRGDEGGAFPTEFSSMHHEWPLCADLQLQAFEGWRVPRRCTILSLNLVIHALKAVFPPDCVPVGVHGV